MDSDLEYRERKRREEDEARRRREEEERRAEEERQQRFATGLAIGLVLDLPCNPFL